MPHEVTCVQVESKVRTYTVQAKQISRIGAELCQRLGVSHYEVSILFVGPRAMRKLNLAYRAKDSSTDVLSFPQFQWKKALKIHTGKLPIARRVLNPMPLGDVVISLADAEANAKESGHGLDYEVCFLLIHGILHLVGHDHMKPAEKKLMFAEQDKAIKLLSSKDDNGPVKWKRCVRAKRGKK